MSNINMLSRLGSSSCILENAALKQLPMLCSVRQIVFKRNSKYMHPKVLEAKFRVAPPSSHVRPNYFRIRSLRKQRTKWSTEEDTHPLSDSPESDYPIKMPDGSLQYFGFTYYPKEPHEMQTIAKEDISPLFMVRRVKHWKGLEWWYKDTLTEFGLGEEHKHSRVVILKNIPEVNSKLWSIKHLVEITSIKLPASLPLDADPAHCFLTEEGEFLYEPQNTVSDERLLESEEMTRLKLDGDNIKKDCRKRWYDPWNIKTC